MRLGIIILICLQFFGMIFFCIEKDGFHEDEGFTLAVNGYYEKNDFSVISNEWTTPNNWKDFYSVSGEHRFDYAGVYYETLVDAAHPPLYYFVLFTLESFLPSTVTKWYGLTINLIMFVATQFLLWLLGKKLFKNGHFALAVPLLYGLTFGALNTVTFIRMYSLATLFCVALVLAILTLMLSTRKKQSVVLIILIAVIGYFGIMTHYYFLIFSLFVIALFILWLAIQKRWGEFFTSISAFFATMVISYISHPSIMIHLTGSYRGAEAYGNFLANDNDKANLIDYLKIIRSSVLNITNETPFYAIMIGTCAFSIILWMSVAKFLHKKGSNRFRFGLSLKSFVQSPRRSLCAILLISVGLYTVVIIRIAPYQVDRYLMIVFPILMLLATSILFTITNRFELPVFALPIATAAFLAIVGLFSFSSGENYLYRQNLETQAQRAALKSTPVIAAVLQEAGWERFTLVPELILYKQDSYVYIKNFPEWESDKQEMTVVLGQAKQLSQNGEVMLFVASIHFESVDVAEQFQVVGSFTECSYFYSIRNWDVYVLS